MKIAICAEGTEITSLLDGQFGRCRYFQIFQSPSGMSKVVENKGSVADDDAGVVASQQIIEERVDVLITGRLGPHAFGRIFKAGIRVFSSDALPIETVLQQYYEGQLSPITNKGPAYGGLA